MKNYNFILPFFVFGLLVSSCSPSINRQIEKNEVFNSSFTGLSIYNVQKEKFVYNYNANKYFTPASNIKLLTFYAGLKELGDSIPGLTYKIKGDSLIFSATGDPSFLNRKWENSEVFQFLKNSQKDLYYLKSSSNPPKLGSGWAWDDYNYSFSAEKSVFPIYGNTVRFNYQNDNLKVRPELFLDSTRIQSSNNKISLSRSFDTNQFIFDKEGNEDFERSIPFHTSEELSIALLEDTLRKNIKILTAVSKQPKYILYSIPADSLYKKMLLESDNFIAEQILLMISNQLSGDFNSEKVIEHIQKNHLNDLSDTIYWVDGSGLSRYNLATPRSMVEIFKKIHDIKGFNALTKMLPNGGVSGTLKDYFDAQKIYIIAKTGSLRNNFSLSGYIISEKNELLIFSFMNSNYTATSQSLKKEMEKILKYIRRRY